MGKVERFKLITECMTEVYTSKNADYGDSFSELNDEFGEQAGLIRLSDKLNRLKKLSVKDPRVLNESKIDTLMDLANYAIMQIMWLEETGQG